MKIPALLSKEYLTKQKHYVKFLEDLLTVKDKKNLDLFPIIRMNVYRVRTQILKTNSMLITIRGVLDVVFKN